MYDEKKMKKQFYIQKWNAENERNIKWELSFDEWKNIWLDSGKYDQRGIYRGQFQMCRYNDEGAYSIDNVRIDTTESNLKERSGKNEKGRYERWNKEGEREKQSKMMLEVTKTDAYKESMKRYAESPQYKINREKNTKALKEALSKCVIGTNIDTGEVIYMTGKSEIVKNGFISSSVSKCANGKLKTHRGYTFKYKE